MEDAKRAQKEQEARLKEQAIEEQRLREAKALRKQKAKEKSEKVKRLKDKSRAKGDTEKHKESNSNVQSSAQASTTSNKEKQLLKLVGAAVVGYLSQWRNQFESSEEFKKHAKEVSGELPYRAYLFIEILYRLRKKLPRWRKKGVHISLMPN
jgi:hypothetical protein